MKLAVILFQLSLLVGGHASAAGDRLPLTGATAETCFTPGEDCAGVLVRAIGESRERILLLAYGFTAPRIADALIQARHRGVDVRLVLDGSNLTDRRSQARRLAASGIPVAFDRSVAIQHSKSMVIDGQTLVTGSYNFTLSANRRNAESVLIVRGARPLAERAEAYFAERERASERYAPVR